MTAWKDRETRLVARQSITGLCLAKFVCDLTIAQGTVHRLCWHCHWHSSRPTISPLQVSRGWLTWCTWRLAGPGAALVRALLQTGSLAKRVGVICLAISGTLVSTNAEQLVTRVLLMLDSRHDRLRPKPVDVATLRVRSECGRSGTETLTCAA